MAGKASVLASRPLHYALDSLSKNTLIDFVVDLARAELGEDACDDAVVAWIQGRIDPVVRVRGDKPVFLKRRVQALARNDEDFRNKTGKHRQVSPSEHERRLAELTTMSGKNNQPFPKAGDSQ